MFAQVLMHSWLLTRWRRNPAAPKSSYDFMASWATGPGSDLPPSVAEIDSRKDWMRRNAPRCYYDIFPDDEVQSSGLSRPIDPP